jgi:hypothetical protein
LPSLLALAKCSRFTLAAALHDFAWRSLSPLHFDFCVTTMPDLGGQLRDSRLLSYCDVSQRWLNPDNGWTIRVLPVTEAELGCHRIRTAAGRTGHSHPKSGIGQKAAETAVASGSRRCDPRCKLAPTR